MKQIAGCASGLCEKVLDDGAPETAIVIGKRIDLDSEAWLRCGQDEVPVRVPWAVILEAARKMGERG
jgi:hypothetical protein